MICIFSHSSLHICSHKVYIFLLGKYLHVLHTEHINLSPFTKDICVWGTPIEISSIYLRVFPEGKLAKLDLCSIIFRNQSHLQTQKGEIFLFVIIFVQMQAF